MLILNRDSEELTQLHRGKKLEASLTQPFDGEDLGKIVSLEFSENNAIDGIELRYLPEGAESWKEIQRVQVKVNDRAYNHIKQRGQFGTRYSGLGDKIEILNGMPGF